MPTYTIQTYGCQMNYSDTERMQAYLDALGFKKVDSFGQADIIMFNTCSIRQKAEDRVFGEMTKMPQLRRKNPNLMVVVAGCMVRKSSSRYSTERDQLFSRMDHLDIAIRTEELPKLASLARELEHEIQIPEIKEEDFADYFQIKATHDSHKTPAQAFVPISNGCDKFCTYCIVPYSRGREKSRKLEHILAEVEGLVGGGCREIVLIGQTVNSYGLSNYDHEHETFADLGGAEPFVHLLRELDKFYEKGLKRVRFTSPHPRDMTDQLIEGMSTLHTQMPYLHLPVQSGDDRTLKRMNRPYNIAQYREKVEKLRRKMPDISISTDVIVGFCGETDEEFENTCKFFEEMAFEHAYLAQYSERAGTTAARFIKDDIPKKIKHQRWHRLNEILKKNSTEALKRFCGRTLNVLVEEQNDKTCLGRSEHFKSVQFDSGRKLLGEIVPVKIIKSREWMLEGELA